MSLSVVMITMNEERNIGPCLESVRWADEMVIVDSGSSDRTVSKARQLGALVTERKFDNFSAQKNAAMDRATKDWILFLDADERIPSSLAREIQKIISKEDKGAVYAIHRNTYFFGKALRFSGTRTDFPVRLVPKGKARYTQPVHEYLETDLPVRKLRHSMIHYSTRDMAHYRQKLNCYVGLELEWLKQKKRKVASYGFMLRSAGKFIDLYFIRLGILDGWTGIRYAALSAYYAGLKYWRYYHSEART